LSRTINLVEREANMRVPELVPRVSAYH